MRLYHPFLFVNALYFAVLSKYVSDCVSDACIKSSRLLPFIFNIHQTGVGKMSRLGHLRTRKDKNGKTRYQMIVEVWKNGRKLYKSKTFSSKKEAINWGNKKRYEIDQGLVTQETLKNRTLSDAIEKYIDEVLPQKPKNARNVEHHLKWWNERLGRRQLTDISPKDIAEFRDKLLKEPSHKKKPRAPATIVRYLSSLSAMYETAIKEWHWIEKNPVKLIRKPKVSNERVRFLTEEECPRLLESCKQSRNEYLHSIVLVTLCTGMRRGEVLGLRWEDLDFERKLIRLTETKNGTTRYTPMVDVTYRVLKKLYDSEVVFDQTHHVFPSLNPSRYIDIRSAFTFALKRAKIDDFHFHDLRHSCGSFLAMSGATDREIAEVLGHQDVRSARRYSHLARKHVAKTIERATDKFIGNGE